MVPMLYINQFNPATVDETIFESLKLASHNWWLKELSSGRNPPVTVEEKKKTTIASQK